MTINDGGSAFPVPNDANVNDQEGMSLRDYFAAKAMAALIPGWSDHDSEWVSNVSRVAYQFSDAMLKERKTQK